MLGRSEPAISDHLDHPHWSLGLSLGTLPLHHVRDGTTDINAHNRVPFTAVCSRGQLRIVANTVGDNILLDDFGLLCNHLLCASARSDKDNAAIGFFTEIVEQGYATVGHDHGHLDLLD